MDEYPSLGSSHDDSSASSESPDEARLVELRAAVQLGLEDIKAGRVVDVDEAFGRIEAMLDELEAAKRSGA